MIYPTNSAVVKYDIIWIKSAFDFLFPFRNQITLRLSQTLVIQLDTNGMKLQMSYGYSHAVWSHVAASFLPTNTKHIYSLEEAITMNVKKWYEVFSMRHPVIMEHAHWTEYFSQTSLANLLYVLWEVF